MAKKEEKKPNRSMIKNALKDRRALLQKGKQAILEGDKK